MTNDQFPPKGHQPHHDAPVTPSTDVTPPATTPESSSTEASAPSAQAPTHQQGDDVTTKPLDADTVDASSTPAEEAPQAYAAPTNEPPASTLDLPPLDYDPMPTSVPPSPYGAIGAPDTVPLFPGDTPSAYGVNPGDTTPQGAQLPPVGTTPPPQQATSFPTYAPSAQPNQSGVQDPYAGGQSGGYGYQQQPNMDSYVSDPSTVSAAERSEASMGHWLPVVVNAFTGGMFGWIVPLVMRGNAKSEFTRSELTKSLNAEITIALAMVAFWILVWFLIGIFASLYATLIWIFQIVAAVKTSNGEASTMPIPVIKFVN